MKLQSEIIGMHEELTEWRHDLHAHPELAFEERRTADFVAEQLRSFGLEVITGIGGTGLVGTLKSGRTGKAIGLRADMDALPMNEENCFSYKSKTPGRMHGCGHDGHTVMLLGAARYLAKSRFFNGTVQFIFQPAEEANSQGSGAKAMIDDGLFERCPVDCIFALHNAPGLKAGAIATRSGPIMASMDLFEVTIKGHGTHGALPETGIDPIVIAATMISAWQTIISRNINAQHSAVMSVTTIEAGKSWNVIPTTAVIRGSVRSHCCEVQQLVRDRFCVLSHSIAEGFGAKVEIQYRNESPVTTNDSQCANFACEVASEIVGKSNVIYDAKPVMGSEDFAFMLQQRPGCYVWLGNSDPSDSMGNDARRGLMVPPHFGHLDIADPCMVHEPKYDFNDSIIPIGATFLSRLVERYLE